MEGGTGVYYQAMPAVGPDGKNVMKLIPVQKVNGHFYQTPFSTERDRVDLQLKSNVKPIHAPAASSYQTQTRLPSLQPIADERYVLKTLPQVRTVSNAIKTQHGGANNLIIHNPKPMHVPLSTPSASQYSVQLPPQPNGRVMAAVQTLPVTVKSPVLPNGHFLQIPANAKVRTLPATALPQSIKCRIMNSVSNIEKGPPTVVFVSPVNSVKLNSDQQVVSVTKPSQIQETLFQNLPAPASVPKTNEEVNTPIKWVVQEGTGVSAPCLIPVSTPNVSSDIMNAVKHFNSVGTVNEIALSKPTPPQASHEKITPGKDNALVMCNGKVYFVAKKNSQIAKDVMISEGGKRGVVSTSPALPASSALGSSSPKQDPKLNVSEIIDLCDDEEEMSTCLGGAPGNLPTPSQTEVDESDEDSNVIFVSYIPPKSETHVGDKVERAASQNKCEKVQHAEINAKSVSHSKGEKLARAEMEKDGGPNNPASKTSDEMMDEQVEGNVRAERGLSWLSENVNMEADKDLESGSPPEMRCQDDVDVAETVSILEPPQSVCVQTTDNTEKPFEKSQPKSDCQLRKEFGITSDVQICLQRTKLTVKPDLLSERLLINKCTLDGLRKVIQESKIQSKIQQMMKVPNTKTEEDEGLKVKRKKLEQDGSQDIPSLNSTHISPASKCSVVPMENSLARQEEVCLPTESKTDKVHMFSEIPADFTGNTCDLTPSNKPKAKWTLSHPIPPSSLRKTSPRSIKVRVCTACPCGTVLGASENTSSLHSQDRPNPCTVAESHKSKRRSCLNKTPGETHQSHKLQPQNKGLVKKAGKKRSSGNPCQDISLLESSTSDASHSISSPKSSMNMCSSAPSLSSLQDHNNQTELSSIRTECGNMTSINTDAETSQQDTSQVQTASDNPSMSFSKKQQGHKIDKFPTQSLYTLETLDAEEIKRRERIKRLKDLLKEKEAALERMQSMNI